MKRLYYIVYSAIIVICIILMAFSIRYDISTGISAYANWRLYCILGGTIMPMCLAYVVSTMVCDKVLERQNNKSKEES